MAMPPCAVRKAKGQCFILVGYICESDIAVDLEDAIPAKQTLFAHDHWSPFMAAISGALQVMCIAKIDSGAMTEGAARVSRCQAGFVGIDLFT